jgi:cellulose synthase/poly-beta-1,6-N-acetylglucosamine synthase-like glycosyltransferase
VTSNALAPLLAPLLASQLGASALAGPWPHSILFVVLVCAGVDFVKVLVELLGRSEERAFISDPALVSVVIPCRNGAQQLRATITDVSKIIPPERILVVDDASTDCTSTTATTLGCQLHRFEKQKGKAAAVSYAVHRVQTPYTLLLDDDTRLGGVRLPTSLLSHDGYDAVAFHVLPDRRNRDGASGNTFLGAMQRYEYGKSMEIGKRFHDVTQSVSCVSGAVGLFRTEYLHRFHEQHTGVFQAEDLQRTMIHLLNGKRIVFANEPVWTVAPATYRQWVGQRLFGWYPGLYHQTFNFAKLMVKPGVPWRLRYEMAYNLYTVVSDPLKVLSIIAILATPALHLWGFALYLLYLLFEVYPWMVVRVPGEGQRRAPIGVLLLFPVYGAVNTLMRTASLFVWAWFRFVTGDMRPRRGPKDRIV